MDMFVRMSRTFAFAFFLPLRALAQLGPIEADRPDQTETPSIVPPGWFQLETGVVRSEGDGGVSWSQPAALFKVGLSERLELRTEFERFSEGHEEGASTSGIEPIEIGLKAGLCEERGWLPRSSLIMHVGVPGTGTSDHRAEHSYTTFRFTTEHGFGKRCSLGANAGLEWGPTSPMATTVYTLVGGVELTKQVRFYGELYGELPERSSATHHCDGGFTWLLNNDLLLDASAGHDLGAERWYVSVGFSLRVRAWRINE